MHSACVSGRSTNVRMDRWLAGVGSRFAVFSWAQSSRIASIVSLETVAE